MSPPAAGLVTFTYDAEAETRTLDIDAGGVSAGTYTVTLRTSLIDYSGTFDDLSITITVESCPVVF